MVTKNAVFMRSVVFRKRLPKSNKKRLTDITEFAIPAGKVYLSPRIVDCFDGLFVTWNISTSSDALLVNSMLDDVAKLYYL